MPNMNDVVLQEMEREEKRFNGAIGMAVMHESQLCEFLNEGEREEIERAFGPINDPLRDFVQVEDLLPDEDSIDPYTNRLEDAVMNFYSSKDNDPDDHTDVCTKRLIESNYAKLQKQQRSELCKKLNEEHVAWLEQFRHDLTQVGTMQEVDRMVDLAEMHDARMNKAFGRNGVQTLRATVKDFLTARVRISERDIRAHYRKDKIERIIEQEIATKAIMVSEIHFPVKLINQLGIKLFVSNRETLERKLEGGWILAR